VTTGGDVILSVDGTQLREGAASLSAAVNAHRPGDQVALAVRRGGAERALDVTLGTQPQQAAASTDQGQLP
jgi:putative serine protease PepD